MTYDWFGVVYFVHIWNSQFVLLHSQKNNETTGTHQTTHATDTSEAYGMTATHTKQLSLTSGI